MSNSSSYEWVKIAQTVKEITTGWSTDIWFLTQAEFLFATNIGISYEVNPVSYSTHFGGSSPGTQ